MHLDRRFLIIVGSSLAWGMIVSLLFYRMALGSRRPSGQKILVVAGGREATTILVGAAEPLSPGASLTASELKTIRIPANLFPKGAYSRIEEVVGRPVISTIRSEEHTSELQS